MKLSTFVVCSTLIGWSSTVASQGAICAAAQEEFAALQTASQNSFKAELDNANQELNAGKQEYQSCGEGTISFPDEHWVMKIPEFTAKQQKLAIDLPQITVKTQEMSMDLPSVICGTGVIGHQPVTICSDSTWEKPIPECKIEMREVIGTQCVTKMVTNKISIGVPEVKMDRVEWSMHIPEVTMKEQEWKFKTVKIKWNAGCAGGQECAKKCQGIMDGASSNYSARIAPASTKLRKEIAAGSHNLNQCFRQTMVAQRDAYVAQYDAGINSLQSSIGQLTAAGASDAVASLKTQREDLIKRRGELAAQFDASIKQIDEGEAKLMAEVAGF